MNKKLIVAHRGAPGPAPENTLPAFQKAIDIGADMIELDVRKTGDNVLVAAHHPIYRWKLISNLSYRELSELSQNQIPTLKEVLELCRGKIKLNVELKEGGYESLAGEILSKNFDVEDLLVTSFFPGVLFRLKSFYPNISIGLIAGTSIIEIWNLFRLIYVPSFHSRFQALFLGYKHWVYGTYKFFPVKDKNVWVWTVNPPKKLEFFLKLPEVTGIITDMPDVALKLRESFI